MKYFPVSESELRTFAILNGAAAASFSIAAGALTFGLDLSKDFALAADIPEGAAIVWGGYKFASFIVAAMFSIFGIALLVYRRHLVSEIKSQTEFDV